MDKEKISRLEKYAKSKGYNIDYETTQRLRDALSDSHINVRVPAELKNELKSIAKEKNIPYQRYIKSILIEAVSKEKAS